MSIGPKMQTPMRSRQPSADERRSAARFVASMATDVDDARELLGALGLSAVDGKRNGRKAG